MPNRIVRENILTSEAVCALKWDEEIFYRRLMSVVDDYGRFEGRPELIRSKCYPLQVDQVRVADISRWSTACAKAGLILFYDVDGRQYMQIEKFGQPIRSKSKYPEPTYSEGVCVHLKSNEISCKPSTDTDSDTNSNHKEGSGEISKLDQRFIKFWESYPKKIGKGAAEKSFEKINPNDELLNRMVNAIELQKKTKDWTKEMGQFIPHPATWLNQKRWEDDHSQAIKAEDFSTWSQPK